jgi:hypothetical protein
VGLSGGGGILVACLLTFSQFFSSFGPYPENPSRNMGTDNDAHRFGS